MLKILGIDREKCIKCERCVDVCLVNLFSIRRDEDMEKKINYNDPYGFCFRCGHCLSICPTKAVKFESKDDSLEFEEAANPQSLISYETFLKLVRARRSIRAYKNQPVEKVKVDKVLQAIRYAPTASNRQGQQFIILTNKNEIAELAEGVTNMIFKIRRLLKFKPIIAPFLPKGLRKRFKSKKTELQIEMFYERKKQGEDFIFYNAPCVIILHSSSYSQMSGSDGGIAFAHAMLAAETLGLGTCWIGFAHEFLWRNKKYRKKLGIPKRNNCYGVLTLGYPDFQFQRTPPRNELETTWLD